MRIHHLNCGCMCPLGCMKHRAEMTRFCSHDSRELARMQGGAH